MSTIGERVERWRLKAGLSCAELAKGAGVGVTTVWRIRRGESEPHMETVRKLAQALGVEPEALLKDRVDHETLAPPAPPEASPFVLNIPEHLTLVNGVCLLVCRDHEGKEELRYKTLGLLSFPALIGLLTLALDTHRQVALDQPIHLSDAGT